jgi:hypothetical protein
MSTAVTVFIATLVLSVCMFMSAPTPNQKRVPKLKRKFCVLSKGAATTGHA